jgi:hypothetical protein
MSEAVTALSDNGSRQTGSPVPAEHHVSFHDVLSAMNPLQYLPVVGTIYRAVTGDQIAEPIRRIGSAIVSGLMGGPIGVAIDLVMLAAEKVTGVDLDKTGQRLLAGGGTGDLPGSGHAGAGQPAAGPASVAEGGAEQMEARPAATDQAVTMRGAALRMASLDSRAHGSGMSGSTHLVASAASTPGRAPGGRLWGIGPWGTPSGTNRSGSGPLGGGPSGTSPSGTSPSGTSPSGASRPGSDPSGSGSPVDGGSLWADNHGADVLNGLELARIRAAGVAYAQTMARAG